MAQSIESHKNITIQSSNTYKTSLLNSTPRAKPAVLQRDLLIYCLLVPFSRKTFFTIMVLGIAQRRYWVLLCASGVQNLSWRQSKCFFVFLFFLQYYSHQYWMGSINLISFYCTVLLLSFNSATSRREKSWKRRDSNPGPPGEKQVGHLLKSVLLC